MNYIEQQLFRLKGDLDGFRPTIVLSTITGRTNTLSLTSKQFEAIKRVLMDG